MCNSIYRIITEGQQLVQPLHQVVSFVPYRYCLAASSERCLRLPRPKMVGNLSLKQLAFMFPFLQATSGAPNDQYKLSAILKPAQAMKRRGENVCPLPSFDLF